MSIINFFLKRVLLATISLLGITSFHRVDAATYTHNLVYTTIDQGTLSGRVTFDDSDPDGNQSTDQGDFATAQPLDTSLITDVTFTYRLSGTDYELTYTDITHFVIDHKGVTDYSSADLFTQLNDLVFLTNPSNTQEFELTRNGSFVQNADLGSGIEMDDFRLSSSSYHSPGPLPLFGLFTAFSSIKRLKSKFKKKYSL